MSLWLCPLPSPWRQPQEIADQVFPRMGAPGRSLARPTQPQQGPASWRTISASSLPRREQPGWRRALEQQDSWDVLWLQTGDWRSLTVLSWKLEGGGGGETELIVKMLLPPPPVTFLEDSSQPVCSYLQPRVCWTNCCFTTLSPDPLLVLSHLTVVFCSFLIVSLKIQPCICIYAKLIHSVLGILPASAKNLTHAGLRKYFHSHNQLPVWSDPETKTLRSELSLPASPLLSFVWAPFSDTLTLHCVKMHVGSPGHLSSSKRKKLLS